MFPTLVVGSHNQDKLREIRSLLKGVRVRVLSMDDFPGCPEAVEDGKTFAANARKKARFYSRFAGALTLADDSGLMVNHLNGKPGVYSARFAGKDCTYRDNNRKLLRLLQKVRGAKRAAKFVCVMALYDKGRPVGTVRGECPGRISFEEKGKNGFGYDPVFIPHGFSKTFAELGPRKNRISHRAKALSAAKKALLVYLAHH